MPTAAMWVLRVLSIYHCSNIALSAANGELPFHTPRTEGAPRENAVSRLGVTISPHDRKVSSETRWSTLNYNKKAPLITANRWGV